MLNHKSNYKQLLASAFFVLSGVSFADTKPVNCVFSPHLICSDKHKIKWSDQRFTDARPITIDNKHVYLSDSNSAYSFDAESGKSLWKINAKGDTHYFFPVVDESSLYLARSDGVLEKRQTESGKSIWSKSLDKGWVYPPVVLNDRVITGGQDRKIWLLDNQMGNVQSTIILNQELVAPLIVVDNRIIASTFDSQLSAYQIGSNKPVWKTSLAAPAFASQSYSNNLIIAADMSGSVTAVDSKTGDIHWQKKLYNNARFWNALHQQTLYSLSESGKLNILNANTGELQDSMQLDGQFAQPPIVQVDSLALFDTSGSVQHIPL